MTPDPFPDASARAREFLRDPAGELCHCHGIPAATVIAIIRRTQTQRVADITRICTAGGGCATCRPDIAALIRELTGEEPDWTVDGLLPEEGGWI